jgi:hypothetical protein
MKKVVIIRPISTGTDTCHARYCQDLLKPNNTTDLFLEYDSLEEAKKSYDDDEELIEMGWTWDTVTVMPCAKENN